MTCSEPAAPCLSLCLCLTHWFDSKCMCPLKNHSRLPRASLAVRTAQRLVAQRPPPSRRMHSPSSRHHARACRGTKGNAGNRPGCCASTNGQQPWNAGQGCSTQVHTNCSKRQRLHSVQECPTSPSITGAFARH